MSRKEILSEGELDALMDSVSNGEVPLADDADSADRRYRTFDFSTREQSLLAQMPALNTLTEKHALALAQGIGYLLRIAVQVRAKDVGLLRLGEAFMAVPEPAAISMLKTLPLNGVSFLVTPGELMSLFVDQYFGGSGSSPRRHARGSDLTPTEKRLNEVLVMRFLQTLQSTWADKVALTTELLGTETNPDFSQLGAADSLAVQFSFEISALDWQSAIDWVVPYALLEPLRPKLGSACGSLQASSGSTDWEADIRAELPGIELEISAQLSSAAVSIARILGMGRGAIVPLKGPPTVTLCVEGRPFWVGEHGAFNGRKSVKITEFLAAADTAPQT